MALRCRCQGRTLGDVRGCGVADEDVSVMTALLCVETPAGEQPRQKPAQQLQQSLLAVGRELTPDRRQQDRWSGDRRGGASEKLSGSMLCLQGQSIAAGTTGPG